MNINVLFNIYKILMKFGFRKMELQGKTLNDKRNIQYFIKTTK